MFSQAEENYLKAIYALEIETSTSVSTNLIAEQMQTKASSVTDMVKKLSDKRLVAYKKYQGVQLSDKGKNVATSIVRKHRLWECFLVDKLNFSWDEVHDIAEQLEHIQSEEMIDRLDAYLDYPSVDPHGDPIPDKDGKITKRKKIQLSKLKENQESVLLGVKDSSDEFLRYLDKKKIAIGKTIKILSIEPFDKSMQIKMNNTELIITEAVAENLFVKEKDK
ncbi:metal-dependent transcriptional regulator [Aureibaculum sp. 2210JD6-5]|uniref:metal-dependent transcriptional regulator n=1 Tax=Aureibaculum sp. 2210JD6-5 TaxID=3103957 RepID=UPI002AAEA9DF|nr:metal-dependent transcriptional regulator [Aureibaculum sp. 2210JD6-5]MDY7395937.1 metal-dependent transcriptional regulator [Aureibaculum sp. 2210JD6-5]